MGTSVLSSVSKSVEVLVNEERAAAICTPWQPGVQEGRWKRMEDELNETQQLGSRRFDVHVTFRSIQFIRATQTINTWTRRWRRPLSLYHCQSPAPAPRCDAITVRKRCVGAVFHIMLSLSATCQTCFETQSHDPLSSSSPGKLPLTNSNPAYCCLATKLLYTWGASPANGGTG